MSTITIAVSEAASNNLLVPIAQIAVSLGLLVVAAVGALIAHNQWKTARTKLQLDLYDKRRPVLLAVRELRRALTQGKGENVDKAVSDFVEQTSEATFLFDDHIVRFLEEFRTRAYSYQDAKEDLMDAPADGEERKRLQKELRQTRQWLRLQYTVVEQTFLPYMRLEQRSSKASSRLGNKKPRL